MKKHKQTKATDIPQEVKRRVFARDEGRCVWCGRSHWDAQPEAHFIPRRLGGLGVEENILTLCRHTCHKEYDTGDMAKRENMRMRFREYLQSKYPDWDETKLIYRKYGGF